MDRLEVSLTYAQSCQDIIESNRSDFRQACILIEKLPLPENMHPMLYGIQDDAYEILEGDRDESSWKMLCSRVKLFLAGVLQPTRWEATVMYGRKSNGILQHSYSLIISRQNAETICRSGNGELQQLAERLSKHIEFEQTDEWFLYSLVSALPQQVGSLERVSTTVVEVAM